MISGTLSVQIKTPARCGRFLMCGFLAEHTQQGVKAVVMIPTIKDNAQQHTAGQGSGDGY